MTPSDIAAAASRRKRWLAGDVGVYERDGETMDEMQYRDCRTLANAYLAEERVRELTFLVNEMSRIEKAVRGECDGVWPSWVYECRMALRNANENNPCLVELLAALGWQGGTLYEAISAVQRMVAESRKAGG